MVAGPQAAGLTDHPEASLRNPVHSAAHAAPKLLVQSWPSRGIGSCTRGEAGAQLGAGPGGDGRRVAAPRDFFSGCYRRTKPETWLRRASVATPAPA